MEPVEPRMAMRFIQLFSNQLSAISQSFQSLLRHSLKAES